MAAAALTLAGPGQQDIAAASVVPPPATAPPAPLEGTSAQTVTAEAAYARSVAAEPLARRSVADAEAQRERVSRMYAAASADEATAVQALLASRAANDEAAVVAAGQRDVLVGLSRAAYEADPAPALLTFQTLLHAGGPADVGAAVVGVQRASASALQRLTVAQALLQRAASTARTVQMDTQAATAAERGTALLLAQRTQVEARAVQAAAGLRAVLAQQLTAVETARQQQAGDEARQAKLRGADAAVTVMLASRVVLGPVSRSGLRWPVAGTFTGGYGPRRDPITGAAGFHPGVDIAAPLGTPIGAAAAGTVVLTQTPDQSGGYGNYTCLAHGAGVVTCYAHQSRVLVTLGQQVQQGQVIGLIGTTGYSTGPHLHFEARLNGRTVDPAGLLPGL